MLLWLPNYYIDTKAPWWNMEPEALNAFGVDLRRPFDIQTTMCCNKPFNSENKTKLIFYKGRTMWQRSNGQKVAKNYLGMIKM